MEKKYISRLVFVFMLPIFFGCNFGLDWGGEKVKYEEKCWTVVSIVTLKPISGAHISVEYRSSGASTVSLTTWMVSDAEGVACQSFRTTASLLKLKVQAPGYVSREYLENFIPNTLQLTPLSE